MKVAQDIADTVDTFPELPILEVGPGMGVLTQFLVKKDRLVKVVEVDYESVAYLREAIRHWKTISLKMIFEDESQPVVRWQTFRSDR